MTSPVRQVAVTDATLSIDAAVDAVRDPSVGGIGLFVGVVRDHDHGDPVTRLDYTGHDSAERELTACAQRAADGFDVAAVSVQHRVGRLVVGDLAVVVAVGAAHRAAALDCCRFLIDDLKRTVPIWKRQQFADGATEWVGL